MEATGNEPGVGVGTSDQQGGLQGHVGSSEAPADTSVGSRVPGFDLRDEQAAVGQQEDAAERKKICYSHPGESR